MFAVHQWAEKVRRSASRQLLYPLLRYSSTMRARQLVCRSEEMEELGAAVATHVQDFKGGTLGPILLQGTPGAGKSVLARGVIKLLGQTEEVSALPSPTFCLDQPYRFAEEGLAKKYPAGMHHIDLYRLDPDTKIEADGLDLVKCTTKGFSLIEWPERVPELFYETSDTLRVHIEAEMPPAAIPGDGKSSIEASEIEAMVEASSRTVLFECDKTSKWAAFVANMQPVDVELFSKIDIRVGLIKRAWPHPESDKLWCQEIDVGEAEHRQVASGIRSHYQTSSDLEGRRALVVCNLKARKFAGFKTEGMVLCAADGTERVEIVEPPLSSQVGERIHILDGNVGEPLAPRKLKSKIFAEFASTLKVSDAGELEWSGQGVKTSGGVCRSQTLVSCPVT